MTRGYKKKVNVRGSLMRANGVNELKDGSKVLSRNRYVGFSEGKALVNHYKRIKELYKEHGDSGVKVYCLEVLAEVDRRIKNYNNMKDPKTPGEEEVDTPIAEQMEDEIEENDFEFEDLDDDDDDED